MKHTNQRPGEYSLANSIFFQYKEEDNNSEIILTESAQKILKEISECKIKKSLDVVQTQKMEYQLSLNMTDAAIQAATNAGFIDIRILLLNIEKLFTQKKLLENKYYISHAILPDGTKVVLDVFFRGDKWIIDINKIGEGLWMTWLAGMIFLYFV